MKKKLGFVILIAVTILVFQKNYKKNELKKDEKIHYLEEILNIEIGSRLEKDYLVFKLNNKYGIMTQDGKIIKNGEYDQIISLDDKMYLLLKEDELMAYNVENNKLFRLDGMSIIGENLYKILKNGK